ncbi:hypothetical protein SNOG_10807 [Parastagonospora nodorum SN15]|uniref:Uncharacterized protein n=1 Tax=Phaeosphaeria nodorum (strain SN15 / ATCC MYA-4574 / FGSC 10173) TaxID=321614 RepID=Q0UBQ7_PHANO|nr:hypothetical protein SNOG_10807 [Parastagonospora nodorum SN15]EAT82201.1 hypothetical protein SNOG_10807 [Parastagonospora nodorum SN15]
MSATSKLSACRPSIDVSLHHAGVISRPMRPHPTLNIFSLPNPLPVSSLPPSLVFQTTIPHPVQRAPRTPQYTAALDVRFAPAGGDVVNQTLVRADIVLFCDHVLLSAFVDAGRGVEEQVAAVSASDFAGAESCS